VRSQKGTRRSFTPRVRPRVHDNPTHLRSTTNLLSHFVNRCAKLPHNINDRMKSSLSSWLYSRKRTFRCGASRDETANKDRAIGNRKVSLWVQSVHLLRGFGATQHLARKVYSMISSAIANIGHKRHRGVAVVIAVVLGRRHEPLHLGLGHVLPGPQLGVGRPRGGDGSLYGSWRD
jgi:hypothetical protein